jgi:hypothetical protein
MKYFTFGMKTMRITQSYNEGNHKPHWYNSKNYADYPIDVGGADGGQDIYYATVDMKVTAIRGTKQGYTNTIWLVATEECMSPIGKTKPFIALTHWNDNDPYIKKLKVGSIVKEGKPICKEGIAGATANHIHMICGDANKGCGDNVLLNSNKVWVSNGYCYKPEQIMYIDSNFTKIENTGDLKFEIKAIGYEKGDKGKDIEKINNFLISKLKGKHYGDYTEGCVSVYKKKKKFKDTDGSFIDSKTLEAMKKDGLDV